MKTDKRTKCYLIGFAGAKLPVIGINCKSVFPLTIAQACETIKKLRKGEKYIYKLVPLIRASK